LCVTIDIEASTFVPMQRLIFLASAKVQFIHNLNQTAR
jgi:hypothetical protein